MGEGTYEHTQKAPWHLMLYAMGAGFLTFAWLVRGEPVAVVVAFSSLGLFMFVLGMSFRRLTVADEGNQLVIRFGPFPLFRRRIWYDDIREIEKGRTTLLDGWGVHISLRGGWVWNIWGFDCVVLRLNRGTLRIGTDDPDGLFDFLNARISQTTER